jgi:hypothetical protein
MFLLACVRTSLATDRHVASVVRDSAPSSANSSSQKSERSLPPTPSESQIEVLATARPPPMSSLNSHRVVHTSAFSARSRSDSIQSDWESTSQYTSNTYSQPSTVSRPVGAIPQSRTRNGALSPGDATPRLMDPSLSYKSHQRSVSRNSLSSPIQTPCFTCRALLLLSSTQPFRDGRVLFQCMDLR